MRIFYLLIIMTFMISSCNRDEVIVTKPAPEIILDEESGVYKTKVGRAIEIAPSYRNDENASYTWTADGKIVGEGKSYVFVSDREGSFYLTLTVRHDSGSCEVELRVDVSALEIPYVSLAGSDKGFMVLSGETLVLEPVVVRCSVETTYSWKQDGVEVSKDLRYVFSQEEVKEYALEFTASNEDGSDAVEFSVSVVNQEDMPFSWYFERSEYNMSSGRKILLEPSEIVNGEGVEFSWTVDGETVENAHGASFVFDLAEEGRYDVAMIASKMMTDGLFTASEHLIVNVCGPEGTFRRAKGASSSADCNRIYEYRPAPGQFINEQLTGGFAGEDTHEEAIEYCEKRFMENKFVSLGAFGGFIVVGFDHSIDNTGDDDFAVLGNVHQDSSEPGIVWVMQDENGDGLPNDTWYELQGSDTFAASTLHDYAVTYYRPSGAGMPVQWTDNLGNKGEIDYLKAFHRQEFYYPLWIEEDTYTLRGTCLEPRNHDVSGNGSKWVLDPFEWGYSDNYSQIDRYNPVEDEEGAVLCPNIFKISNAVDFSGQPVVLKYVDFVKVQTGVNTKSGWLGELSTEVCGFYDWTLKK